MPSPLTDKPFVTAPPSPQNAVDLFAGEWASRFPAGCGADTKGTAGLFDDARIRWADESLRALGGPGFRGQDVLELGPLEGGHSHMLDRLGAREVTAVEANARAYVKCLIAKELLGMPSAHFLLGDALAYLRSTQRRFGAAIACAFLNHVVNPVEVIELLSRCSSQLFLWTVVFSEPMPPVAARFAPPQPSEHAGFRHTLHPVRYGEGHDYGTFWGGTEPSACWMGSADIVAAVRHFGFSRVESREEPNPYGNAVAVAAVR